MSEERRSASAAPCSSRGFHAWLSQMLTHVSSSTTLPLTGFREKWRILSETLLGHPQVGGGSRPRDYPMGSLRRRSAQIALTLQRTIARTNILGPYDRYRLYDFVVMLLAAGLGPRKPLPPREAARDFGGLVVGCLHRIFRAFCGGEAPALSWLRSCCEMMGLSEFEQQEAGLSADGSFSGRGPNQKRFRWAEAGAALCYQVVERCGRDQGFGDSFIRCDVQEKTRRLGEPLEERLRPVLAEMERQRFRMVRLKALKVQPFIGRCLTPPIQRGASAWCSQATARLRDRVLEEDAGSGEIALACDSDAAVLIIAGAGRPLDPASWIGDGDRLARSYPKLVPYLDHARQVGLHYDDLDPILDAKIEDTDLLRFAIDGQVLGEKPAEADDAEPSPHEPRLPPGWRSCTGVMGHRAFQEPEYRVPGWWQGGMHGDVPEQYGPVGIAYALAGPTYRQITGFGIAEEMVEKQGGLDAGRPPESMLVSRPSELLERLNIAHDGFLLVRLDGDGVGRMFAESPPLSRPGLSMHLESHLRNRWLDALRALMEEMKCDVIPVILIYFGGDDLQFMVPRSCFPHLLRHLRDLDPQVPPGEPGMNCTLAAVPMRNPDGPFHDLAHHALNRLMKLAKKGPRDEKSVLDVLHQKHKTYLSGESTVRLEAFEGTGWLRGLILHF